MNSNRDFIHGKIREFIRKYYLNRLLKGAILFVVITLVVFIAYALLEYFSYFNSTVRTVLFFSYIALFAGTFIAYIAIPLCKLLGMGKQLTNEQIAGIIGRHFPQIDDKLLNIFQLERMIESGDYASIELISAAIDTKIDTIKPFPFTQAIPFKKTAKYLKWALVPILLFVVIFAVKSEVFTQSSERIINYNTHYEKPAPYSFEIQEDNLKTFQNEEFVLHVKINGSETPNAVFIAIGNRKYQLSKSDNVNFSYTFKNLQANTDFHLFTDEVTSPDYTIEVLPKPVIISYSMLLHYPAYLHKNDETVDNNGDITIPDGTQITWSFYTKNTQKLSFILPEKTDVITAEKDIYKISKIARTSFEYAITNKNQFCASRDTLKHSISVIPDQYPEISVISQRDSVLPDRIYFKGNIKDDYGFTKVRFVYSKFDKNDNALETNKVVNIDINPQVTVQDFYYYFDATALRMEPGYRLDYHFEVFDNDGVNGAKSSRTTNEVFRVKTESEIDAEIEKSSSQTKDDLEKLIDESKDLLKDIAKLEKQMLQNKEMTWQDKKKLENLVQQYQELKKQIDELKEAQKQQQALENQYKEIPESLIQKQKELEKRFNDVLSDEIKEMLEKMQKLMNEMTQKEDVQKQMRDIKTNTEDLNKALDQQLALYKQLEFEKKYNDIINKAKSLSEEQKMLSKETEAKALNKEEALRKQQNIENQFNELKKEIKELEKLNKELDDPNKLLNTEKLQQQISQDMKESKDALNKNNRSKAASSQQSAGEKMEQMADEMEKNMLENEEEDLAEDIESARQILDNLVQISFNQEANIDMLRPLHPHSARLPDVVRTQHTIRDNMKLIADSLDALARRQTAVESFILGEVSKIDGYINGAIDALGNNKLQNALSQQQFAMTSMNNLALMLAESMTKMKNKQSECKNCKNKKSGNGSCNNPGSSGKKKSAAKSARELQQQLNRQMEAMKRSMEQGKKQGETGQGGQSMSEQFARMAAQQEAIRRMMQEYQNQLKSENGVGDKAIDQMLQEMEKTERDLVNRIISTETINRQKRIETRMLESERAQQQREQEEKRESTEGRDLINPNPPKEWNTDKRTQQQTEMLKSIPPNLNYYYKEKVNQYFYNIE